MSRRLEAGARLVVASHNPGKVWEIKQLIAPFGLDAVSAGDLGLAEPEETETTFAGNARLKAVAAADGAGLPALADDSGLEVAALDGAPGVYSANWAGPGRDFGAAMQRVHDEIARRQGWSGEPPAARFISMLCLARPGGGEHYFEGSVSGHLVWPPRGGNGFGYDPMFVADGERLTFGEMEPAAKYAISHRTRAFDRFRRECLEGSGASAATSPPAHKDEALAAAAANLSTREELVRFIGNLRADLASDREITGFLERMQASLGAASGDQPAWRSLAKALLAASRS